MSPNFQGQKGKEKLVTNRLLAQEAHLYKREKKKIECHDKKIFSNQLTTLTATGS